MPTYDFTCPRGHEFEKFYSKISDASSEVPCPECGETAVRQISGGAGLLFKGSGFYLTDYGRNAHRGESKSSADGGTGSSGEPKSGESKSGESKSGESRSGESKSGESKPAGGSGDARSDSSKSAAKPESKPAAGKASAPTKKSE